MRDPEKLEGIPNVKSISGSEGLPEGAKKFNDIPTAQLLKQMWNQKIAFYCQT